MLHSLFVVYYCIQYLSAFAHLGSFFLSATLIFLPLIVCVSISLCLCAPTADYMNNLLHVNPQQLLRVCCFALLVPLYFLFKVNMGGFFSTLSPLPPSLSSCVCARG